MGTGAATVLSRFACSAFLPSGTTLCNTDDTKTAAKETSYFIDQRKVPLKGGSHIMLFAKEEELFLVFQFSFFSAVWVKGAERNVSTNPPSFLPPAVFAKRVHSLQCCSCCSCCSWARTAVVSVGAIVVRR